MLTDCAMRDVSGGEAADIRHAEMQQVDPAGGTKHAADASASGHPQRPGARGLNRLAQQRHAPIVVTPPCGADVHDTLQGIGHGTP